MKRLSNVLVLLILAGAFLSLRGDDQSRSYADPLPAPIGAVATEAGAVEPSIDLDITPANPIAGTHVEITVRTRGIPKKTGLEWRWPSATYKVGDRTLVFGQSPETIKISKDKKHVDLYWPGGGEFPLSVSASVASGGMELNEETNQQELVIYSLKSVVGQAVLKLAGGASPVEPVDPVDPIPAPSAELQAAVKPVREVMSKATDKVQRARWQSIWSDFSLAVVAETTILKSTGDYKAKLVAFASATATKAKLTGAFPGFSAALEQAFVATFGADDAAIDVAKAKDFSQAVAWACGG